MTDDTVSPEAFAQIAARAGVKIAPDELARMSEGYGKLQGMLARLPKSPDLFDEPATVFVPPGSSLE